MPRDKGASLPQPMVFTAVSCLVYLMGGNLPKWLLSHGGERREGGGKLLLDPKVGELASLIRPVLEYSVVRAQGIKT